MSSFNQTLDASFVELIADLPERQTSRPNIHGWKPSKRSPCACVMSCSKCNKLLPISDFYTLNRKGGRRDILGATRSSTCKHCAQVIASLAPIELRIFRSAKARATRRNMEFLLNPEDIVIPTHCPVLGIPLMDMIGVGKGSMIARQNSPSLDRIDNTKGYVPGNIVIVSLRANNIKSDASLDEINALASFYKKYIDHGYTAVQGCHKVEDCLTKMHAAAKSRAKARGLPFDIETEDIVVPDFCPILGIALQSKIGMGPSGIGANASSPSLDRIDNSKGYVKGNVMVISMRANNLKSNATLEEIFAIADFFKNYSA